MTVHVGVAEYIGTHLSALAYEVGPGGNVFVDAAPAAPDRCVVVYADGGAGEADAKLPYDPVAVLIVVRSDADIMWALERWQEVYGLLHGLHNITLPDGTWLVSLIATAPYPQSLGADANGRIAYSLRLRGEALNNTPNREEHE